MPRILVVEDEPDIGMLLEHVLDNAGYDVELAITGEEALAAARRTLPDLVLLDLMLPDMNGFEILKQFKRNSPSADTRFIIVTARKDEIDRVLGFELGADDYVVKPFSPRELVLRVRAVLQRESGTGSGTAEAPLTAGPIMVDLGSHRVEVSGDPVQLTLTEFKLLTDLIQARGRVRTRASLLAEVWGYDSEVTSRTVDTHIRRLRNKLGSASTWLMTVRGVGYRIQNPEAR